ncbi:MAG: hypothetical protein NUW22_15905, partial [Acidobacteria bacterium]|nr:hypothetical protein [Acidobacteriota bacterium]
TGATGLVEPAAYMAECFERTSEGYVVYKTFGSRYPSPPSWTLEPGAILSEVCNPDRGTDCGSGINVGTRSWVEQYSRAATRPFWRCLIRWEWLPNVIVPFGTDGKIRCSRLELLGVVEEGAA